jgi:hypothetical protein
MVNNFPFSWNVAYICNMIIAREKKKTNIAEYVLYMWQVEDIIRACRFDIRMIEDAIIKPLKLDPLLHEETVIWYNDLIDKMHNERITRQGHLKFVTDVVLQMETLNQKMFHDKNEEKYHQLYSLAKPNIDALKEKSGHPGQGDVQTCLTGLYGLLVLRLKKQNISGETHLAMQSISNLMAFLTAKYMQQINTL